MKLNVKIRVPTKQYAYMEIEDEFESYEAVVKAHNDLTEAYEKSVVSEPPFGSKEYYKKKGVVPPLEIRDD